MVYSPAGPQGWKDIRNRLQDEGGYSNPDNDPRGRWRPIPFSAQGFRPNQMYDIISPAGAVLKPPTGRCWGATEPVFKAYLSEGKVYFPRDGAGRPRIKQYEGEEEGLAPMTWWSAEFAGDNQAAKKESIDLFGAKHFDTPKPEKLLQHILAIATNPGDLVLDSFAGSGTTGAVAHKMGRRWIMVELGEHARTHIVPRLRKVIDGEDSGGITEAVGWKGGGGFRFERLAPSLLERDRWGNWIISRDYNPAMLAEAMCKHMGFAYAPSQNPLEYWRHGSSSERDFIFVTTHALTHKMLEAISYDVGPDRHLLVCCKAFSSARQDAFPNLTLAKIPHAILSTCEWGRDDYSLRVANLPTAEAQPDDGEPEAAPAPARTRKGGAAADSPTLFDAPADAEG
jgi:adenine-specific DNA-methyltransferase